MNPNAPSAVLVAAEQALTRRGWVRYTLAPGREFANSLEVVATTALTGFPRVLADELARGLAEVVAAQAEHFPQNICCDLDYMAAELVRLAMQSAEPGLWLRQRCAQLCRLQALYGRTTAIHFRYVHDLIYGFDWAKWVARGPNERAGIGQYDEVFLDYLEQRGDELLELIAEDDAVYGQLAGDRPRNPFPFSREPAAELLLHRSLAIHKEIPISAWDAAATPQWNRPFAALRIARAQSLGLGTDHRGGA